MIYVVVEGGIVQDVVSDDPAHVGLQYTMIDYDVEGADVDDLRLIRQSDGEAVPAYVGEGTVQHALIRVDETGDR